MAQEPEDSFGEKIKNAAVSAAPNIAWMAFLEIVRKLAPADQTSSINKDKDEDFELNPVMGKFATQNEKFGQEVLRVRDLLLDYSTRSRVDRPLNILLAAAPGTGKSFLAKELAKELARNLKAKAQARHEVYFEEVHVAAFRSPDDLLTVLQRVQSANLKGALPFVLFDEVDGKVAGNHMLANFLAPMWDGKFYDGSESYALGPAIFCFAASHLVPPPTLAVYKEAVKNAGQKVETLIDYSDFAEKWQAAARKHISESATPNKTKTGTGEKIEKGEDFADRIDVMLCIPPVAVELLGGEGVARENIGLTFSWVLKHFPHIVKVEKAAAVALGKKLLVDKMSRREVERSIFTAKTPKNSSFNFSNLPERDQHRYRQDSEVTAEIGKYYRLKSASR